MLCFALAPWKLTLACSAVYLCRHLLSTLLTPGTSYCSGCWGAAAVTIGNSPFL